MPTVRTKEHDKVVLKAASLPSIDALGHEALTYLDRVLDNDWSQSFDTHDGKTVYVSNEVQRLVETAVRVHRVIWPRSTNKHPKLTWWLKHGVMIKSERARSSNLKVRGENDFACVFCRTSLATFGWNDGVRQLPDSLVHKIERHTFECALRTLVMYADSQTTFPNSPKHLEVRLLELHSNHAQSTYQTNAEAEGFTP